MRTPERTLDIGRLLPCLLQVGSRSCWRRFPRPRYGASASAVRLDNLGRHRLSQPNRAARPCDHLDSDTGAADARRGLGRLQSMTYLSRVHLLPRYVSSSAPLQSRVTMPHPSPASPPTNCERAPYAALRVLACDNLGRARRTASTHAVLGRQVTSDPCAYCRGIGFVNSKSRFLVDAA